MRGRLEKLRGRFDYVLVDAPPLLPVADASGLSPHMDGVLLTVYGFFTSDAELQKAAKSLIDTLKVSAKKDGTPITTTVFTDQTGRFYFPDMPEGRYRVWAQALTFKTAKGTASLADEKLNLELHVAPKDFSPLTLRTPVRVRGTFANPDISLDKKPLAQRLLPAALLALWNPLAAVLPLMDPGDAEEAKAQAASCAATEKRLQMQLPATKSASLKP